MIMQKSLLQLMEETFCFGTISVTHVTVNLGEIRYPNAC